MKHFYTYVHVDPRTDIVKYVGKGCYGRAWDVTRNRSGNVEDLAWCKELSELGYVPSDWVVIKDKNLTELEALSKEKEWLHNNFRPNFNRQSGERNYQAKLTDAQAREIFALSKAVNHSILAQRYGISRSAVTMISTRKQWRAATACMI